MRNCYLCIVLILLPYFSFAQSLPSGGKDILNGQNKLRNHRMHSHKTQVPISYRESRSDQTLLPNVTSGSFSDNGVTGQSGTGANIDVYNYQIWWRMNPDSAKGIKGVVKTKFKTTVAYVKNISFDLSSLMVIDKVTFRGLQVPAANIARTGNKFIIALPTAITTIGTKDSIIVVYHGRPQDGTPGGGGIGYDQRTDPEAGNYICTLSESYEDRDWWPCKADMQDKADTIDITVNVPWKKASATDTFWVASNGKLVDSTINTTDKSRSFTFLNRSPMATYLVCATVAKFKRFYRGTINIGGTNVPVVYYLLAGKADAIYKKIIKATISEQ